MSIRERLRQFHEATLAPTDEDHSVARAWLDGPLYDLFCGQHPRDIVHSAATARWLLERGHRDADLVAAALLHDVGKGDQRRWERVAYVVAGGTGLAQHLGDTRSGWRWRRAIGRSVEHSERGARMLARAGASPRVIELTRRHHEPAAGDGILELLQRADAAS